MRHILGEHRGGDGASALKRGKCLAGDQRLASQDSVLIGERKPDDFELLLFDDTLEPPRRLLRLVRPEAVTTDETQRTAPPASTPPNIITRNIITRRPRDGGPCRLSPKAPARPTARCAAAS